MPPGGFDWSPQDRFVWTERRCSSSASAGVRQPSRFQRRVLSAWATAEDVWGREGEAGAFGKAVPEQPVRGFVGAALPRALRAGEIDLQILTIRHTTSMCDACVADQTNVGREFHTRRL